MDRQANGSLPENDQTSEEKRVRAEDCIRRLRDEAESRCGGNQEAIIGELLADRAGLEARNEGLLETVSMFGAVFSSLPVGVCVTDDAGRYVKVNRAYCTLCGYTEDELIGQPFTMLVPPEYRSEAVRLHEAFLRDGREVPRDCVIVRKDGQRGLVANHAARVSPQDGRLYVVTVTDDITNLARVTREREIYFQVFRDSIHPALVTDTQGRMTYVNAAFTTLYGYSESEALGRTPRILNPGRAVYADLGFDAAAYDALFGGLWRSITDPAVGFWEGDLHNRRKDGVIILAHIFIHSVRDETGKTVAYFGMPMDVTKRRQEELDIRLDCYRALNQLAASRDKETGGHLYRISIYTRLLAEQLGMPRKYCNDIEIFSPLHDIGKVGVPDHILLAPRALTPEEFEIMKRHATLGYEILRERTTLEMAADIAHGHHERWDGSGYPEGLRGEAIPLAARLMAVADVYDALVSERHYKPPWPHDRAAALLTQGAGSHFDPGVIDAFHALEQRFRAIADEFRDL